MVDRSTVNKVKNTAIRLWPVWLVVAAIVLFQGCQSATRPAEPAAWPTEQQQEAIKLVRQIIEFGSNENDQEIHASLSGQLTNPIFVTLYGPDRKHRTSPIRVSQTNPPATLSKGIAIRQLANQLRQQLEKEGIPTKDLSNSTIEIQVAGDPKRLPLTASWYVDWLNNPGVDGYMGLTGDQTIWSLPNELLTSGRLPSKALARLTDLSGGKSLSFRRFRTFAFAEGENRTIAPNVLFRGNVLKTKLEENDVVNSLTDAGKYLAAAIGNDGRYCYNYLALEDRCDSDYNLLRHAGTTYSLYQIHEVTPDPTFTQAAERAMNWLRKQTRQVEGDPNRVFLLEGDRAKLGAAGLSLLALVEREKVMKDGKDKALMTKIADYIRGQQREDGYFPSYYEWKPGVVVPKENSIYYPGEAMLGLVRLYSIDPQPRFLECAKKAGEFLVKKRWRFAGIELYVPPDAWLTQAIAELDEFTPQDWLRDYAYEIVQVTDLSMIRPDEGAAPDLVGGPGSGFLFPGVTPAGARNEGTTAAWRMAKRRNETDRVKWLRNVAISSALFQLNQQYRPENSYFLPNPNRARGGFRTTAVESEVRIDYVQHNATGLVGVLEMMREVKP